MKGWIDSCGIRIVCYRFFYFWEFVLRRLCIIGVVIIGVVYFWGCIFLRVRLYVFGILCFRVGLGIFELVV